MAKQDFLLYQIVLLGAKHVPVDFGLALLRRLEINQVVRVTDFGASGLGCEGFIKVTDDEVYLPGIRLPSFQRCSRLFRIVGPLHPCLEIIKQLPICGGFVKILATLLTVYFFSFAKILLLNRFQSKLVDVL